MCLDFFVTEGFTDAHTAAFKPSKKTRNNSQKRTNGKDLELCLSFPLSLPPGYKSTGFLYMLLSQLCLHFVIPQPTHPHTQTPTHRVNILPRSREGQCGVDQPLLGWGVGWGRVELVFLVSRVFLLSRPPAGLREVTP